MGSNRFTATVVLPGIPPDDRRAAAEPVDRTEHLDEVPRLPGIQLIHRKLQLQQLDRVQRFSRALQNLAFAPLCTPIPGRATY